MGKHLRCMMRRSIGVRCRHEPARIEFVDVAQVGNRTERHVAPKRVRTGQRLQQREDQMEPRRLVILFSLCKHLPHPPHSAKTDRCYSTVTSK